MKTALVLSGGSIKGAFQVGAINAIIEKGIKPEIIYGISVGSLNGSFIAHEAGKQNKPVEQLDWASISAELERFWIDKITEPKDVTKKRSLLSLGGAALFGRFKGLVDTTPLHDLVRHTINRDTLLKSAVKLTVGAVNILEGTIVYANPSFTNFLDYVLASTSIPIMMPGVNITGTGKGHYLDGGMRDVAPMKIAIKQGATKIICVTCQSEKISPMTFNYGNLKHLSERIMDIIVNETTNNDIEWATSVNPFLPPDGSPMPDGPLKGYRKLDITLIRPPKQLELDLQDFDTDDIKRLINMGYTEAMNKL